MSVCLVESYHNTGVDVNFYIPQIMLLRNGVTTLLINSINATIAAINATIPNQPHS